MILMAWRLTKLAEAGAMSHEQASLVKAWNTLRGREVRVAAVLHATHSAACGRILEWRPGSNASG